MKSRLLSGKQAIILATICSTLCFSCKKEPGEGGTSSIRGKIIVRDYNVTFTTLNAEYDGADRRVYIIYGDNDIYDDDFRTGPDGYYQFKWLRKGEYTIFIYSVDTIETGLNFKSGIYDEIVYPVEVEVEITKNKKEVTAPEIVIVKCRNC
ncbi:MAG: hypothetical protein IIA88_09915 [Bacteroidetes bacterium]|nr:hypothetical protein [Bacteroidota bacterium]